MPDRIPDDMPDRMPELMPNRRSEDMRARYAGQNIKHIFARFDPLWRQIEGSISFNVLVRGGGGFDALWREVVGDMWFNVVVEGVVVLTPYANKLKVISYTT